MLIALPLCEAFLMLFLKSMIFAVQLVPIFLPNI